MEKSKRDADALSDMADMIRAMRESIWLMGYERGGAIDLPLYEAEVELAREASECAR